MSENDGFLPEQIFPASRYKAVDFVLESKTSIRITMNLLSLPTPYVSNDLYVHSGELPEVTYRTPWVRGKEVSDCKLSASGSVLTDLRGKMQQGNSLERFSVTLSEVKADMEVIPSSNPDSVNELDQDEYVCLLKELQVHKPDQELFLKWTSDLTKTGNDSRDSLLLPELLDVDFLPRLKKQLPTLRAKVSRLRTLIVSDPLQSLTHQATCKDFIFSRCASYQKPPDADRRDTQEEFRKESLMEEESMLLPMVVDRINLSRENSTDVRKLLNVSPELLDEQPAVLDVLQAGVPESTEIFQYEAAEEANRTKQRNPTLHEPQSTGLLTLPSDLELDETLTWTPDRMSENRKCLSTRQLQRESVPTPCRSSVVSASAQTAMEAAVWRAEKHLTFVAALVLAEPHVEEEAADFERLSEAWRVTKGDRAEDKLQPQMRTEKAKVNLCRNCEFTERFRMKIPPKKKKKKMEDFHKLFLKDTGATDRLVLMNPSKETQPEKSNTDAEAPPTREKVADLSRTSSLKIPTRIDGSREVSPENLCDASATVSAQRNINGGGHFVRQPAPASRPKLRDDHRRHHVSRRLPERSLDPLHTFMLLRSHTGAAASQEETQMTAELQPPLELQLPPEQIQRSDRKPTFMIDTVSGNASRKQETETNGKLSRSPDTPERGSSREIQIQATAGQRRAYSELLAFAQPCLNSARRRRLAVPAEGDFRILSSEQTRFLLKQQETMLSRARAQDAELLTELEQLFTMVAQIHLLVTLKELLLKCELRTALEFLRRAVEMSAEPGLRRLLRRLQVVVVLGEHQQETSCRLLELQTLLQTLTLQSRAGQSCTEKIVVLISDDSDHSRALITDSLRKVPGAAVASLRPEGNQKKLNGAGVVSSVRDGVCVLACEQHVGPDFPWTCFSLVVEFDLLGPSPWSKICSEKNVGHVFFTTVVSHSEESSGCLEENVPYSLFVTDGLLESPLLLQTLESRFNITVLERSHCPSLQMLGGIHQYIVITVDERTAIILQREEELCEEQASERVVMRLTALSLQFSCCWFILLSPELQEGGLSSVAFSSLVLVFSSAMLFSRSEDLDVKALLVSGDVEAAEWISWICFHSLMSSDRDPADYLDRSWLTVIPSQEERCLLLFPSLNPLVAQLMLRRSQSLCWLLTASLSQLQQLLPEVPHKVLKLFNDIACLYTPTSERPMILAEMNQRASPPDHPQHLDSDPAPPFSPRPQFPCSLSEFPFRADAGVYEPDSNTDFRLNMTFGSPGVLLKSGWSSSNPWREGKTDGMDVSCWTGGARAAGRDVQREEWASGKPGGAFTLPYSPELQPVSGYVSDLQHPRCTPPYGLSPPTEDTPVTWGQGQSSEETAAAASYGFGCWFGQERKRSSEDARLPSTGFTPLKRSRLSYERVPGRSDGQTRLRLF